MIALMSLAGEILSRKGLLWSAIAQNYRIEDAYKSCTGDPFPAGKLFRDARAQLPEEPWLRGDCDSHTYL